MKCKYLALLITSIICLLSNLSYSQDSTFGGYKNVVRYDLSGGMLVGINKYIVFGYERVLNSRSSISFNVGKAGLPKIARTDVSTDSFTFNNDVKNSGFNISGDYRFYLQKENKYNAPHGIYIGPYISYNSFKRENNWEYNNDSAQINLIKTNLNMNIFSVGGELGYQFIVWKRLALDFVMVGPGVAFYKLKTSMDGTISEENKQQIRDALKQVITEKFPGLNYVLSNKDFNQSGTLRTWSIGYRYIIHIGYAF